MRLLPLLYLMIVVNSFAMAISFSAKLSGDEILCELMSTVGSERKPGIYAVDIKKMNIKLIIPYGKSPLWSNDHSLFTYWYDGHLYIADIRNRKADKAGSIYNIVNPVESKIYWVNNHIVYMGASSQGPSLIPNFAMKDGDIPASKYWVRKTVEQVGEMSFSNDGSQCAYESVIRIPGVGSLPAELRLWKKGSEDYAVIESSDSDALIVSHPQWQPNGDLVAYNRLSLPTRKTTIGLWNTKTQTRSLISINKSRDKDLDIVFDDIDTSFRFIAWSPKGDRFLVCGEYENADIALGGPALLYAIPLDDDKPIKNCVGSTGIIIEAKWSRDGSKVAYLRDMYLDYTSTKLMFFEVWNVDGGCEDVINMMSKIPEGLMPVNIDW